MRRQAVLFVALLAAVGTVVGGASAQESDVLAVRLQTSISPGPYLFGDRVHARLDVFVDNRRVDPATVHVDVTFTPYQRTSAARRMQAAYAGTTRISYLFAIDCLTLECLDASRPKPRLITFPWAIARYRDLAGVRRGIAVKWPTFRVFSRLRPGSAETATQLHLQTQIGGSPVQHLLVDGHAPAALYRLSPVLLAALLAAVATFALAGAAFAGLPLLLRLRDRRRQRAAIPAILSPLEAAVERVERTASTGAAPEQREALARLARELRQAGLRDLVVPARRLAWSASEPTADQSLLLARRVRDLMKRAA